MRLAQHFICIFLCFFSVSAAMAAGKAGESADWPESRENFWERRILRKPVPIESWEKRAIDGNIAVSEWIDGLAETLDLFLVGKKLTRRQNETSFRILNSSVWTEGIGYKNATAFNFSLRLPNVEEYLHLKFTSYDERQERRGVGNSQFLQTEREQNYGATIGLFQKLGNVRTAFEPRIELSNPLKVSHALTFDTDIEFEKFAIYPKVEFFAESKRGTGVFSELDFGAQLNHIYAISQVNQATYEDKTHNYLVGNGIAISRVVMKNAGITYSFFFYSDNQPAYHLASYSLAVTWSHLIYKNILDYNLTPHIDFAKLRDFTGRTGLNFNINLRF